MAGKEQYLGRFRERPVRVLQIGRDGEWARCFPRGELTYADAGNLRVDELAERGPFDVIVGDGKALTSFDVLFPHLRADGVFVIEGGVKAVLAHEATLTGRAITGISVQQNTVFVHKGHRAPAA